MALKTSSLAALAEQTRKSKPYVYKDIRLDIERNDKRQDILSQTTLPGKDIVVDFDESAIRNSLKNLFNTKKGQRFLFPLYGLDLYQYVFEPVSELTGRSIGEEIYSSVTKFEPRVNVVNVNVVGVPEENKYEIDLIVNFPTLKSDITVRADLDLRNQSFIFVETSRNR